MRRIASPQGKLAAGIVWLAAIVAIAVVGLRSGEPPWAAMGIAIGIATMLLARLSGGYGFAAPAAVFLPLAALSWSGSGEFDPFIAFLLLMALACAEFGALVGVWWRAWSWSGSITRTR
jgi:hypothetical protein